MARWRDLSLRGCGLAGVALGLPALASAYESPEQPVTFTDSVDVWEAVEFDTGPLPAGSPVTLRFFIASDGGANSEIDSRSEVSWPDALTQGWASVVDGGVLELVTDLSLNLEISWDIFGISGSEPLWSEGLFFEDSTRFDGLLLSGGSPENVTVAAAGGVLQSFSFRQTIVTGVEVAFSMDLFPAAEATLDGRRVDTTDGVVQLTTDSDGQTHRYDVPAPHPGYIEFLATYHADLAATLSLMLTPTVDFCVAGQCFELAAFDIPIDLIDTQQPRIFAPVSVHHPLPSLVPPMPSHDFGVVDPGNTVNLYVDLENIGEMYLEGWAEVVGDPEIQVFPEYFYAESGETDGLVVSFSPSEPGERSAFLRITSNDPLQPELEIPIRGEGFAPEPPPGESTEDGYVYEGRTVRFEGCGCQSVSPVSPLFVGILPLLYTRRRRA